MRVLWLHCADCVKSKEKDKIAVLMMDKETIHIVCENHKEPKQVYSFTIPVNERPEAVSCLVCSDEDTLH